MFEKDLQTQVWNSIRKILIEFYNTKDFVYHKLSDMSIDQKPADCFLFYKKKWWLLELKLHKNPQAFAFSKVENHQINALTRANSSGNKWFLLIWVNLWRKKSDKFICIFNITNWNNIISNSNRKSIKISDMKAKADYVVYKDFKTNLWDNVWDLTKFLYE